MEKPITQHFHPAKKLSVKKLYPPHFQSYIIIYSRYESRSTMDNEMNKNIVELTDEELDDVNGGAKIKVNGRKYLVVSVA